MESLDLLFSILYFRTMNKLEPSSQKKQALYLDF